MPWIEWCHQFVHISIHSRTVIKTVPNFAIFKSPSTDSFICSQNVLLEGRYTYSMRWIQWRCLLGRTGPGCGDMAKNVSYFAIFKHPSTDSFIYSQNILRDGRYTYLTRWFQCRSPFGCTRPGCGAIVNNVSDLAIFKPPSTDSFIYSQNVDQEGS